MITDSPFTPPEAHGPADGVGLLRWSQMTPSLRDVLASIVELTMRRGTKLTVWHLHYVLCIEPGSSAALRRQLGDLAELDQHVHRHCWGGSDDADPLPNPTFSPDFVRVLDAALVSDEATGVDLLHAMIRLSTATGTLTFRRLIGFQVRPLDLLPLFQVQPPSPGAGATYIPQAKAGQGIVMIMDDPVTPMQGVIDVLMDLGFEFMAAMRVMFTTHHRGRAVLAVLEATRASEMAAMVRWHAKQRGHDLQVQVLWAGVARSG